jgi:hypothetical protein
MLSALALARRIEAGELTPRAVVEMSAQAIAAREKEIGAFAALDIERACNTADALASKPLRGLPVGMKDIFDTVDFPTAYGSPIYAGHRPRSDAAMVMAVRRAGGVIPARPSRPNSRALSPPPRAIRAIPRTRRAARRRAPPPRSPPACCRSRSAARPAAR